LTQISQRETSSILGVAGPLGGEYLNYQAAEKGEAVIVTPLLVDCSGKFQSAAARELEAMVAPCPRNFVNDNCSVAARMIIDYGDFRKKYGPQKKDE